MRPSRPLGEGVPTGTRSICIERARQRSQFRQWWQWLQGERRQLCGDRQGAGLHVHCSSFSLSDLARASEASCLSLRSRSGRDLAGLQPGLWRPGLRLREDHHRPEHLRQVQGDLEAEAGPGSGGEGRAEHLPVWQWNAGDFRVGGSSAYLPGRAPRSTGRGSRQGRCAAADLAPCAQEARRTARLRQGSADPLLGSPDYRLGYQCGWSICG